jgi:hypothetical protein
MTRSIKKANRGDHIDRYLPGNVIDGIVKHLNIPELLRTSVLSTKWRYMWKSVPELEFSEDFFFRIDNRFHSVPEILRIIMKVLFLHNGPIYRFSLDIPCLFNFNITTDNLNKWILVLSRKGIKDLELLYHPTVYKKMPSHIFSCQELTRFRFTGFNLSVPPNFRGLNNLLDLCLERNSYEFGALENFITGCPLLEKLSIKLFGDMYSVCLKKAKNLTDLTFTVKDVKASILIKSLPPKIQRLAIKSRFGYKVRKLTSLILVY